MKNILTIIRSDLRGVKSNVMTSLVIFGLVIIPLLFSTFNVLASWNPFANTGQLKIAVASTDKGFDSDLVSLNINLGDQVLAQMSENKQIDWVITDKDDAIDGTESGEYYASIVLPTTFSDDLLTFYVEGAEPTKLDLYTNEKKNALSTLITSQGADGVIDEINESFTETLSSVGLGVVSSLTDYLESEDAQQMIDRVDLRLENISARLDSGASTVRSLSGLIDSTLPLVESADSIIAAARGEFDDSDSNLGDGSGATSDLDSTLRDATDSLEASLQAAGDSYAVVGDRLDDLFESADSTSSSASTTFSTLADRVQQQTDALEGLRDGLESNIGSGLPDVARPGYDRVVARLDAAIERSSDLHDSFATTAENISSGNGSAQSTRDESRAAIDSARTAVSDAVTAYREDLKPQLDELGTTLDSLGESIDGVKDDLAAIRETTSDNPGSLQDALRRTGEATAGLADRLDEQAEWFSDLRGAIEEAGESGDFSTVSQIIGSDPDALASHLAAPVSLDREPVFPVSSFGAGMAPLYTVLSLWIGALLTAVLVRVKATDPAARTEKVSTPAAAAAAGGDGGDSAADSDDTEVMPVAEEKPTYKRYEAYFGRFGLFALIGLAQSTMAVLSLIFFVEIEPVHPFLLLLCGWVTSLVFMLIVYTLVLTFGSAGKAVSVLLLVFQVSAAGGAYPLPLLPQWFQNISPWLPATHSIDAMRAAIAGIYRGDFWIEIGLLLLFTIPFLILGLLLRRFFDGYNKKTDEAMESTKIMS